ncbi:hypothetical protein BHU09_04840 [Tannerella sp. oral taxon 808]|nr:hypothetical protein BHU09_04840 [Tannerella sp. oral taxon 808]
MLLRYLKMADSRKLFWLIMSVLMAASCEQRDPEAEYKLLSETVYSSPREGAVAAQEYIDYFNNKEGARINDAYGIRDQYYLMRDFFSYSFDSYADFLDQSRELNEKLSSSKYTGVQKMWLSFYEAECNRLLEILMRYITENEFDAFFKIQIRQLCDNEFMTWDVESIDQISLSEPTLVSDGTAKKSYGEYRVHLRGNILGIDTDIAIVKIDGVIGVDASGKVRYARTGYQFVEKP